MAVTGRTGDMKTGKGVPFPQGCTVKGQQVNFSVAVPEGKDCELILYKKGKKEPVYLAQMPESDEAGSLRFLSVELEKPEEYEYLYKIGGKLFPDVYGRAFSGRESWSTAKGQEKRKLRTRIVPGIFDWEEERFPRLSMDEVVAYSLHVRGFTKHSSSGVKARGTFAGVLEKLPYLKELGINQIHLMPVYEFEENQRYVNYWGYGEAYFFAPKASYAVKDPVTEMKEMVRQMHLAGIEVVLEMPFTGETAFTLILDCLRYWVTEYHIDGFILNPYVCSLEEIAKDPVLAKTKILKKEDGFQNVMRRFLKGDEGMIQDVIWQLKHTDLREYNYIASHNGFTLYDTVAYDGKHNEANGENNQDGPEYNYSWNCGAEGSSRKKAVNMLRKNQIFNAFFLLLFAQGTPCILSGDEFMNTQKGNNNAYCQDNLISWLDWGNLEKNRELHDFVKSLVSLRKKYLGTQRTDRKEEIPKSGIPQISYHGEDAWQMPAGRASRQLGVFYHEDTKPEKNFYIAYNMHWLAHTFALPSLKKGMEWAVAAGTHEGVLDCPEVADVKEKKVQLEERTIKVFVGRQATK